MPGFRKLANDMIDEMRADAKNVNRGKAFRAACLRSETMSLDEYIQFISDAMEHVKPMPSRRRTDNFKL